MMVFNETLRLEPPVIFSGLMVVNDPTDFNGVTVQKNDNILVNMH
jgi:cytochrome P450